MNGHFRRAMLLYEQSRFALAANEYCAALADDPQDVQAMAMLAICLARQGRYDEATGTVESANQLAPDFALVHYAHSVVLRLRNRYAAALEAIHEAVRLESSDPEFYRAEAQAYLYLHRHNDALAAAHRACELNPNDANSINLKVIVLLMLNRTSEANAITRDELRRSPNSASTHANCGWVYLEGGRPKDALQYFREALRLDPMLEWARQGMLQAMRASYSFYRWPLSLLQLALKLPPVSIVVFFVGVFMSLVTVDGLRQGLPELALLWVTLMAIFVAMAIALWVANPLMNLLLSCNQFGRCLLTAEQLLASRVVACMVAAAIAFFIAGIAFELSWSLTTALVCALSMPAVAGIFRCRLGPPRLTMLSVVALTIAFGIGVVWLDVVHAYSRTAMTVELSSRREFMVGGFFFFAFGSQIASLVLSHWIVAK